MRAAVLWSGGKESNLACHRVMTQDHDIALLLTFILDDWPALCHPLSMMSLQSEATGIPHVAVKGTLPHEVIWRVKTPIECGTGTTAFPRIFDRLISDIEFERKVRRYLEEDKVTLQNKEQLSYYEIYRSILGIPRGDESYGRTCPKCHSNARPEASYCKTCGSFPI